MSHVDVHRLLPPQPEPDHGGARETVLPNQTGWLVPPRDPHALAAAIAEALALTTDERAIVAERATAHARTNFDTMRMCAETLDVYREILFPDDEARTVTLDPEAA